MSRQAVIIWLVALATYFLAVFHRSSLAVAGLLAVERFDISASQLASFAMLQLFVYAVMQIPVGLLVDRFGPRSVLITGALVLTLAQSGFALAQSYPTALVARISRAAAAASGATKSASSSPSPSAGRDGVPGLSARTRRPACRAR